jgi:hypothetical protein
MDWFAEAMSELYDLHGKKGADYALDGDEFSNFESVADAMSSMFGIEFNAGMAIQFNIEQKRERLVALRQNDREPTNESVLDTYRDLAVYQVLLYAWVMSCTQEPFDLRVSDDDTM